MSALSTALDKMTNLQFGENMNQEYSWSKDINELIVQFYFQLTRTSDIKNLEDKYQELLKIIFNIVGKGVPPLQTLDGGTIQSGIKSLDNKYQALLKQFFNSHEEMSPSAPLPSRVCKGGTPLPPTEYIKIIYKLIGHTRDIVAGKGEYNLAYMLISGLYKFSQSEHCPINDKLKIRTMATCAIESLVRTEINEHPYGSWKDMKYFCNYHIPKEHRSEYKLKELNDPLLNKVVELIIGQLRCDLHAPVKTLAAKWIPREKSEKFGWITPIIATKYYSEWCKDPTNSQQLTSAQKAAARRKCLTHFRQLVSKINKDLNTPQINQCNGTWGEIDFDKNVTSITLRKQSKAFQSISRNGKPRTNITSNEDRIKCTKNYTQYVNNCKSGKSVAKGKRVSIIDFVRDALHIIPDHNQMTDSLETDIINAQWKDNGKQNSALEDCIAMVDTSASMECDNNVPLYSAMGLGIRIAEKSKLGKRILTFSSSPTWINLDDSPDFVSMVHKVRSAPWGANTNFRAALDLILDTAINNSIYPRDMKKMVLIILSDMQIDYADVSHHKEDIGDSPMFEMMKQKYHDAGLRSIYNQPYELPHIVFWNLRSTEGFPSLSTEQNTSMMSGSSPVLLNTFCNKGIDALREMTPWNNLIEQLSNKRYDHLGNIVDNLWLTGLSAL